MKSFTKFGTTIFIVTISLLSISSSWADESVVTPEMVGHWEGNAQIIVSWCHQTNLTVAIDIHDDGSVTGKIGDATLISGHFFPHRSWPWRHTLITGKLDGDIVAAEGITRSYVTMICDFNDGIFRGQLDTNGSLCVFSSEKTRKEKMSFSARFLKLTRHEVHEPIR